MPRVQPFRAIATALRGGIAQQGRGIGGELTDHTVAGGHVDARWRFRRSEIEQLLRQAEEPQGDHALYSTHPVPGIQCGDLVSFRQSRIVERVLDKVIQRAVQVKHRLPAVLNAIESHP
jgi:hypothetical protein